MQTNQLTSNLKKMPIELSKALILSLKKKILHSLHLIFKKLLHTISLTTQKKKKQFYFRRFFFYLSLSLSLSLFLSLFPYKVVDALGGTRLRSPKSGHLLSSIKSSSLQDPPHTTAHPAQTSWSESNKTESRR